jgi:hypothetical protein
MTNSAQVSSNLIVATRDAVSCDLEGEAVILHLPSESYFGLDPVGATIWEFIQQARTFDEICDRLTAEYDVSREQCESEVRTLIEAMHEQGLVEVVRHAP